MVFIGLPYNVLTFEITEPETRDFFNGFLGILSSAGGMIGPIAAGFIITRFEKFTGYSIVFGISLSLFALAVFLSFSLKPRPANGKYCFKRILDERKNNENWRLITNAHFFQGLREGTFLFIISVFVYISTGSELALGTFGLINSGISFIAYYAASRLIKKDKRKKAILTWGDHSLFCCFVNCLGYKLCKTFNLCSNDCSCLSYFARPIYVNYI